MKNMALLAIVGMALLGAVGYAGCALGFRSDCIRAEAGIKAQYKQDQNNYDNMWKKFREMSQVNESYAADLKKVYDSAISGRYGADGSKAAMQWIQEHNPNLDSATYAKLQAAIEAGRNGFEAEQKTLLDKKMQYEVLLGSTTAVVTNMWFNFPRINLADYDIVTSDRTDDAFKNKKDDEIKLR